MEMYNTVKPVLRDHCNEGPPVLKDHPLGWSFETGSTVQRPVTLYTQYMYL